MTAPEPSPDTGREALAALDEVLLIHAPDWEAVCRGCSGGERWPCETHRLVTLARAALSRSPEPEGWEGMPPPQHEQPLYPHNDLSSTCCPGCLWTALVGARGLLADANAEIDRVAADRNEYAALLKEAALAALSRSPERATADNDSKGEQR